MATRSAPKPLKVDVSRRFCVKKRLFVDPAPVKLVILVPAPLSRTPPKQYFCGKAELFYGTVLVFKTLVSAWQTLGCTGSPYARDGYMDGYR